MKPDRKGSIEHHSTTEVENSLAGPTSPNDSSSYHRFQQHSRTRRQVEESEEDRQSHHRRQPDAMKFVEPLSINL